MTWGNEGRRIDKSVIWPLSKLPSVSRRIVTKRLSRQTGWNQGMNTSVIDFRRIG